jgi:hypothetical protein
MRAVQDRPDADGPIATRTSEPAATGRRYGPSGVELAHGFTPCAAISTWEFQRTPGLGQFALAWEEGSAAEAQFALGWEER